jgi:DNA-binding transcriptional regulator YdaS (Cro superfamily)
MRNRTRVIAAAAAATAALATGSTAAAMASTTGAKPSAPAKTVSASSVSQKCAPGRDLAAQLGVSSTRLDQVGRAVKTSMRKGGAIPTEGQVSAALARGLGIPQARVRQAFAAGQVCVSRVVGSKAAGQPASNDAFTAAVARELHVSTARANAALQPLFAAGRADPSSPAFAAAARSLGVSTQQLTTALIHAKQSLAGGS